MKKLISLRRMPPARFARYCCSELKECYGAGRVTLTGVRWAESIRRKNIHGVVDVQSNKAIKVAAENGASAKKNGKRGVIMNMDNEEERRTVEMCFRTHKTIVNPIIDWTDEDVWEFIHRENIPYCELYDEGKKRLGCIACPLANKGQRLDDLERWPVYRKLYKAAFEDMLMNRQKEGIITDAWKTSDDVFRWWMIGNEHVQSRGQIEMNLNDTE